MTQARQTSERQPFKTRGSAHGSRAFGIGGQLRLLPKAGISVGFLYTILIKK